jgi:hypothetical protein
MSKAKEIMHWGAECAAASDTLETGCADRRAAEPRTAQPGAGPPDHRRAAVRLAAGRGLRGPFRR